MEPVELIREGNYVIAVHYDEDGENPRKAYDNLGTMVCSDHRNYSLGDEQVKDWGDWLARALRQLGLSKDTDKYYDFEQDLENEVDEAMRKGFDMFDEQVIRLPLYLYDHGGITMKTSPFTCAWDSGQVGFIYVTKEKARKEYGNLTKANLDKVVKYLVGEVEAYAQYLEGQVYGYIVKDVTGWADYCERYDKDEDSDYDFGKFVAHVAPEIDSCWGYYGYDHKESGLMENAMNAIEYATEKEKKHA